ncbi:MAG: hypothetical protein JXR54_10025, partial [Tannerellaceae bacterium]|nr:hypothetical protein [Tannerellaceae bacterium]
MALLNICIKQIDRFKFKVWDTTTDQTYAQAGIDLVNTVATTTTTAAPTTTTTSTTSAPISTTTTSQPSASTTSTTTVTTTTTTEATLPVTAAVLIFKDLNTNETYSIDILSDWNYLLGD